VSIPSQEQVTLLTDYDTDSAYSLAYQNLYANISFNWNREQVMQQTVLLTTPTTYVGQAAVATNVAIAAAQSGTPTIIVDADLHAPTLQHRFGINESTGLSDLLAQKTRSSVANTLCDTFIPRLRLLCAGSTQLQGISMLFATRLRDVIANLRQFLAETEHEPSIIIFNGPAVLTGTDAALISDIVNQTFLTIVSGRTTRRQAKQAKEQLRHAHAQLTGIIMLNV